MCLCPKTIPLASIHSLARQIVPPLYIESLTIYRNWSHCFVVQPCQVLPSIKIVLRTHHFSLYFHCTLYMGLHDPGFYLKHSFSAYTCLPNESHPNLYQHSPMLYALPFSIHNSMYLKGTFTLIFSVTQTPFKSFEYNF